VQDEVNQEESEQNEVDEMKKGADSTGNRSQSHSLLFVYISHYTCGPRFNVYFLHEPC